jgi:hypothetical protein
MNPNSVTRHYDKLTAEERFALIFNAGVRGDKDEQARLVSSAPRIVFNVAHHQPFVLAFNDLAEALFLELLELAGSFFDKLTLSREALHDDDVLNLHNEDEDERGGPSVEDGPQADGEENGRSCRWLWAAMADGFVLKTKASAWRLWCDRRHLPAYALWEMLPGWQRLKGALEHSEGTPRLAGCAFAPEGMLRWLNCIRSRAAEPIAELDCTPEAIVGELERWYQDRLHWHGAD